MFCYLENPKRIFGDETHFTHGFKEVHFIPSYVSPVDRDFGHDVIVVQSVFQQFIFAVSEC